VNLKCPCDLVRTCTAEIYKQVQNALFFVGNNRPAIKLRRGWFNGDGIQKAERSLVDQFNDPFFRI
jgi:hypothetical protein